MELFAYTGLITDGSYLTLMTSSTVSKTILSYYNGYIKSMYFMKCFCKQTNEKWNKNETFYVNELSTSRSLINLDLFIKKQANIIDGESQIEKNTRLIEYLVKDETYKFYTITDSEEFWHCYAFRDYFLKIIPGYQLSFKNIHFVPSFLVYFKYVKADPRYERLLRAYNFICKNFINFKLPLEAIKLEVYEHEIKILDYAEILEYVSLLTISQTNIAFGITKRANKMIVYFNNVKDNSLLDLNGEVKHLCLTNLIEERDADIDISSALSSSVQIVTLSYDYIINSSKIIVLIENLKSRFEKNNVRFEVDESKFKGSANDIIKLITLAEYKRKSHKTRDFISFSNCKFYTFSKGKLRSYRARFYKISFGAFNCDWTHFPDYFLFTSKEFGSTYLENNIIFEGSEVKTNNYEILEFLKINCAHLTDEADYIIIKNENITRIGGAEYVYNLDKINLQNLREFDANIDCLSYDYLKHKIDSLKSINFSPKTQIKLRIKLGKKTKDILKWIDKCLELTPHKILISSHNLDPETILTLQKCISESISKKPVSIRFHH